MRWTVIPKDPTMYDGFVPVRIWECGVATGTYCLTIALQGFLDTPSPLTDAEVQEFNALPAAKSYFRKFKGWLG